MLGPTVIITSTAFAWNLPPRAFADGSIPRAARERVDSSGRVAWISLTQFVRATVLVALADAIGVMIVGRHGEEATLLGLAGQLEAELRWTDRRPPLG